jgi:hypothetical protein
MKLRSICVYCGSSENVNQAYFEAARGMGQLIASKNMQVIFGGGQTGLMGAVADGALAAGGEVIGVIPEAMMLPDLAHAGLTRLEVVKDMHERKARMAELAGAFVALPGGFGTMEEFFEALTWLQLGFHGKAVGLLNIEGYFDNLLNFLQHVADEKFAYQRHLDDLAVETNLKSLIKAIEAFEPPEEGGKWD